MNGKRYAAVICEYNPFHRGHQYQLNEIKKSFDGVVCIMSGDLVQRGDAAVAGKYLRAEAALRAGADLVLELPAPWCCSSAADFARAGVKIACAIGADALAFGAESEAPLLHTVASLCLVPGFDREVRALSSGGGAVSYPAALCAAVRDRLGSSAADAMKKPNNILAVEYLKNLFGTEVQPFAVTRAAEFPSSSEIRALKNADAILGALSEPVRGVYSPRVGTDFPRDISRLDAFFIGFFRSLTGFSELCGIYGMTPDLAAKLFKNAKHANGFYEFCNSCVDKKHTAARVRRAAIASAFGFDSASVKADPAFSTVLAANASGCEFLSSLRKNSPPIEIITKPAHAARLNETAKRQFALSKRASDVALLTAPAPVPADSAQTPTILF